MGKKDLLALLNLLYRLVIHVLKKPVKWLTGYSGYDSFVRQYSGNRPVKSDTRALYPSLSWCIDCGICIGECREISNLAPPAYLFIRYSRLLTELVHSEKLVKACMECDTCLIHCPTGVRMKQIVLVYRDMAGTEAEISKRSVR